MKSSIHRRLMMEKEIHASFMNYLREGYERAIARLLVAKDFNISYAEVGYAIFSYNDHNK